MRPQPEIASLVLISVRKVGGGISDDPAGICTPVTQRTGTYLLLRWPEAPRIKAAPGSSDVPALPPSLEQNVSLRPPSCLRIPVSLLRPGSKRWSWQDFFFLSFSRFWQALAVFRWSERGDSLGFGAERNPNAWRRLGSRSWTEPCHAGTEGFRVSPREDGFHT